MSAQRGRTSMLVVAATTTTATGGFAFPGLGQGQYVVELRVDDRVVAMSKPIMLVTGGTAFVQVGGAGQAVSGNKRGKGGLFWTALGAGVGGGVGLAAMIADEDCRHRESLCAVGALTLTGFGALVGLMLGAGR